ncbi:MAG TPA: urea carboxylase [Myxococcota bacterium]|nr:urea carboxylase [Myxococcota bacterium]
MFDKVLVANRGEIACRVLRTLRRLGIRSVAVFSEADGASRHVAEADEALFLGPAAPAESYLRGDRILALAKEAGAEAVHPGYGFLSENAGFAGACEEARVAFVGPTPEQIRAFGLKHAAREIAAKAGVAGVPGSGLLASADLAAREATAIGYPIMLKSTAGGGGIGMRRCDSEAELRSAFASVSHLGRSHFGDDRLFVEKAIVRARHVEVQIFGDGRGRVLALGERDCSLQRRNQKVVEETPAPGLSAATRSAMAAAAVRLGQAVAYRSAGTVEFVLDADTEEFWFLEVNTRLQVEHGVTELALGVDLVEWMLRVAAGEADALPAAPPAPRGAAIQVRVYAESPAAGFLPSSGTISAFAVPDGVRCDTWIEAGTPVPPHYDPLLAKLLVHAGDRAAALARLEAALAATRIEGVETNLAYLREAVASGAFRSALHTTRFLDAFPFRGSGIEVVEPGAETSVQDWPGRLGAWDVGVPPSGPMDDLAFRLANRLVGNAEGAAGLELTLLGPTLRFRERARVALAGAPMDAELDGAPAPLWQAFDVAEGSVLRLGGVAGSGCRTYLAVRGGLAVPEVLGSRSTFALGLFGGHCGRTLRAGDMLPIGAAAAAPLAAPLREALRPQLADRVEIGVLYGPHGAPDFFTDADVATFFATDWKVHYHSNRTGIRLLGPKPAWARPDGGEAGLHPSNLHDNAYAIGAVDFTGDMPIVLGRDGPSLGGFVCPAVVADAELWKVGQLKAGDRVRFVPWTQDEALAARARIETAIATLAEPTPGAPATSAAAMRMPLPEPAILYASAPPAHPVGLVVRRSGDRYVLVEYGAPVLDLALRLRVHALMEALAARGEPAIAELVPGIRTLQVRYDPARLPTARLLDAILRADADLPEADALEVPGRILHLPLSFDDPATRLAIEKYMKSVRADAPWCPSNLEFIRRINGLPDEDAVRRIVFDASYLVLGLGDVYLGAPVATPLDPRHRLVTTKYNPARTWTPENAVGIGGAYLCIYGMEGPGGYQFVGRTVQVWNRHRTTAEFAPGKPWLLRFFDQIRFHPVGADALLRTREAFLQGRAGLDVETTTFRLGDYRRFLADEATGIESFRAVQRRAFAEERARWEAAGQDLAADAGPAEPEGRPPLAVPPGSRAVTSPIPGVVWKRVAEPGARVAAGDVLYVLEAMKAETAVRAPIAGEVVALGPAAGELVAAGEVLAALRPSGA